MHILSTSVCVKIFGYMRHQKESCIGDKVEGDNMLSGKETFKNYLPLKT